MSAKQIPTQIYRKKTVLWIRIMTGLESGIKFLLDKENITADSMINTFCLKCKTFGSLDLLSR